MVINLRTKRDGPGTARTGLTRSGATRSGAAGPSGPFAALAGSSRQAAWRRTLVRRLLASLLVALAVVLLLVRPGPLGALAGDPKPTDSGSGQGWLGSAGSGEDDQSGDAADAGTGQGGDPSAVGPAGVAGALAVVRIGGLRGASAVPVDAVGISVPSIDDSMAARLRAGDVVDVYASGRKSPVARAARVIDVIAFRAPPSGGSEDAGPGPVATGGSRVFLAVAAGDAARVADATKEGDTAVAGFWFAVRPAPKDTSSAP
ncbi:MAG: hypothetical protein V9G19_23405 [Tetrasphaera sp.]